MEIFGIKGSGYYNYTFPGRELVVAMQRAHAAVPGQLAAKQAAGVGLLEKHVELNHATKQAWEHAAFRANISPSPSVAIARACLNEVALITAGTALEAFLDPEKRLLLLTEIIGPFIGSMHTCFGDPYGAGTLPSSIEAKFLPELLKPRLPVWQLEMAGSGDLGFASRRQVTNNQFRIFMEQTGHRTPFYWDDRDLGIAKPDQPVVGVSLEDARAFAAWQGKFLPGREFMSALSKHPETFEAQVKWEWSKWSSTSQDSHLAYSLQNPNVWLNVAPSARDRGDLSFRVAGEK